jgi:uncharacterized protein with PIN domain
LHHNDVAVPPKARCPVCGGELRFSHREYAGRGMDAVVKRCASCGHVMRDAPRSRAPVKVRSPRKRQPVDEGPPLNPVIDAETAERLRRSAGDS